MAALACITGLSALALLCACGDKSPTLTSITVGGEFETRYLTGESFDGTGMEVTAHYSDGTTKALSASDYTVSPQGALKAWNKEITVSYEGATATRSITVGSNPTVETAVGTSFARESHTYSGTTINYRVRMPDNTDTPAPIVLFLHGAGERGSDNEAQMKNAIYKTFKNFKSKMYDAVVIAPQCPAAPKQWVNWPWANGNYSADEVAESNELATVFDLVQTYAQRSDTDASRIYVVGLSMGGFGTWDLLTRHSDTFAAGVPICGGGDPSKAEILATIPIYTFHGTSDTTVPFAKTTPLMVSAINQQGKGLLHYHEFPGKGHNIWDDAIVYAGDAQNPPVLDWLFSQRKK